ncbi:hypothetical protein PAXRUDRAFT_823738 [Paxillus rubicundulus Ve08.2h10]|uniref:Uncharacterized protein n=1 Tax=Paxillus rubicundulus Ve08.2h10 TaxID=930991 RepID=A0A0D0EC13_9AGAM|nr:hypothetical protein PAXRUDRAFT_823738 [Paxillus rubicundulus Ve08.2h10]
MSSVRIPIVPGATAIFTPGRVCHRFTRPVEIRAPYQGLHNANLPSELVRYHDDSTSRCPRDEH